MTTKAVQLGEDNKPTGRIVFTFDDKTTETFDLTQCNEDIQRRLAVHGASQKLGDSYAGAAKDKDPVAFAKAAVAEVMKNLYAGDWRGASVGGGTKVNDLATALSRLTGKSIEEAMQFVEDLSEEDNKVWRGKPKVKATIAAIQAERAVAKAQKQAEEAAKAEAGDEAIAI